MIDKTGTQWGPYLEWSLEKKETNSGNPFDIKASVCFEHKKSGKKITTDMFYTGNDIYKFRFSGTKTGEWVFETSSEVKSLNGNKGNVLIKPASSLFNRGFLTSYGNKWGWSGNGKAFVPQLVMYRSPHEFYNQPQLIDEDIEIFLEDHGFNGFHVTVFCGWLDIDQEAYEGIEARDPVPDFRTFETLELLIKKTYEAGGMVHFWFWGDNDADHHMTPMKEGWGGKNGPVDERIQRYIAARLGPLPGWSMGYGFDLESWVDRDDLKEWYQFMSDHFGWHHMLGGRDGSPGHYGDQKQVDSHKQLYEGLDYAGYTHFRPDYDVYTAALKANPDKPVMSEDRFRIRKPTPYPEKDYDFEMTRRGLWHSFMAGGVANIWSNFTEKEIMEGRSDPYPNKEQLKTCMNFFEKYYDAELIRDNKVSDARGLSNSAQTVYYLYKENTKTITLNSEIRNIQQLKAVDTLQEYREIDIEVKGRSSLLIRLPYKSDWAVILKNC